MAIKEALLPEFDQEAKVTRTHLERIIDEKLDWMPHDKSMTLRQLASHIAELPGWGVFTLSGDSFDVNPTDGSGYTPPKYASRADLLQAYDANIQKGRSMIASMADADFMKPWSFMNAGQVLFTMPKVAVLRSFVFNHLVHHRGQLSVYLRMTGAKVPSSYGPSADEGGM